MFVFVVVCLMVFVVVCMVLVTNYMANRPVDMNCVEDGESQSMGPLSSAGVSADVAKLPLG